MTTAKGMILVVDDDLLNRVLLSTSLEEEGYTVELAEDGRQAMAMIQAQAFDVVLLDMLMPEIDGFEVLAWMKGDENLRHIPVIVISALDDMDSVVRCIEMGAIDYLQKPFNPALLRARINASLASKRLREMELEMARQALQALEASIREQALRQEIQQLRIEVDEVKREKHVNEIVDSDFFHGLQAKARIIRARKSRLEGDPPGKTGVSTPD